ncbi:MAG: hypothetical protein IPN07_08485 [Dehalococcoidia bacterium]|nr:hypothetical protein [Dehalococcoidia bacterium]
MAAERGERGYSELIDETLERYLGIARRQSAKSAAEGAETLFGSMSRKTARQRFEAHQRVEEAMAENPGLWMC